MIQVFDEMLQTNVTVQHAVHKEQSNIFAQHQTHICSLWLQAQRCISPNISVAQT